ncbi:aromatic ring-hydroxylating oxygenase subunit alpha [Parahaliea mediterranea]|uniref:aromatic ring-hydroxylating oxygenase subunit alpha n=1 Tax=Parahaliea mediterranea TaxID=651086 RepID=UPI000E2EA469|nr:aromatic ring-hydroxylating dioxygenase subunit alpha [Parahaliea mediterranea]
MEHEDVIALTQRLIDRVNTNTSDEAGETMTVPNSVFLDDALWQREREALFFSTPQTIGFAGEVAKPGSFMTTESMGIPIVVTRDEAGVLHAFINACAHRGSRVADGCGERRRLNCRFHGWSYALDGRLAGRPRDDAFEPANDNLNLIELPVSDCSGLIVVGLRPTMSQSVVHHALDDIAPAFAGYALDKVRPVETRRYDVRANWKMVVNLSHESYHFATLHRDSLSPLMTAHAVTDEFGDHTRWAFPLREIADFENIDRSQWPSRPPATMNHTIYPGTVVVINPNDAQMLRVEPGRDPGSSVVYYSGVCNDLHPIEEARRAYEFGGDIFNDEDLLAAEQCQQGVAACAQGTTILGRNEPMVQFWHRKWRQATQPALDKQ